MGAGAKKAMRLEHLGTLSLRRGGLDIPPSPLTDLTAQHVYKAYHFPDSFPLTHEYNDLSLVGCLSRLFLCTSLPCH